MQWERNFAPNGEVFINWLDKTLIKQFITFHLQKSPLNVWQYNLSAKRTAHCELSFPYSLEASYWSTVKTNVHTSDFLFLNLRNCRGDLIRPLKEQQCYFYDCNERLYHKDPVWTPRGSAWQSEVYTHTQTADFITVCSRRQHSASSATSKYNCKRTQQIIYIRGYL